VSGKDCSTLELPVFQVLFSFRLSFVVDAVQYPRLPLTRLPVSLYYGNPSQNPPNTSNCMHGTSI
ncbi:hypothetical protein K435DRAFT_786380, partial [Dendrothele bispora CBS 962.96]